jgi:hypothetical protein
LMRRNSSSRLAFCPDGGAALWVLRFSGKRWTSID